MTTPPPPVDISTIEAAKENIVPLHSGRSASQLASVLGGGSSTTTRSGLGLKLDLEHSKFQQQIHAVEVYERTGEWTASSLDLNQVIQLSEDPLDISHQYVRFIIANYPSGANASNKLVPVLEETTRRFLNDERYTNDPRYFRLWAHYAKNMESPEECYRFLFAKGIGEKLAALYEEYAKVLESNGKRKQADQVYLLGINRRATPLDRLKRSHLDFQARMLVAPPIPSPPHISLGTSSTAVRPILSSSSSSSGGGVRPIVGGGATTTSGTGVGPKVANGGSMFAVFKDESAAAAAGGLGAGQEVEWQDFGTVKSRKRENDSEKKEWSGETMPQGLSTPAPASGGGFKLEVYRDETATSIPAPNSLLHEPDVFLRSSNRQPSEAEQLRTNPFKNYSTADVDLLTKDPLENLQVIAPPTSTSTTIKKVKKSSSSSSSSTSGETKRRTKPSSSSSSSKSKTPLATTSSESQSSEVLVQARPQQIAFKLEVLKDGENGEWISFEEERVRRRKEKYVVEEVENWGGWEHRGDWEEEVERTGRTTYKIDVETGWPVLYDLTGAPLCDFLRPPPLPVVAEEIPRSPSPLQRSSVTSSPSQASRESETIEHEPSLSPSRTVEPSSPNRSPSRNDEPSSPSYSPIDPNRPPSPTINTKAANALLDGLFAKTLDFTRFNPKSKSTNENDDDEDDYEGEEPSTDESDDEDNDFQGGLEFGGASQFSTQQATQASEVSSDGGFVPFSQTRSMMGDDSSFFGSQDPGFAAGAPPHSSSAYGQGLYALSETDENDENVTPPAAPMQLFRDVAPTTAGAGGGGGGFRPVTKSARAPLGAKSVASPSTPLVPAPQQQPAFSLFNDSQRIVENVYEEQPEDYDAPLRGGSPELNDFSDGYAMGRRERGVPSRYAPFVDNMTPITERTLEITAAMNTNVLSASQRSRRSSAFGNPAPVVEDDEPSTEEEEDEDEEDAGDRAFVASYGIVEGVDQSNEGQDSSSEGSSSDSSSDSEDDNTPPAAQYQQRLSLSVLPDQQPLASSPFDESSISRLSLGGLDQQPLSFDNSPNTSLPEGLTIAGNQSGMTTEMVVADSTSTNQLASVASVDPYDRAMLRAFLSKLETPIEQHANVVDLSHHTADKLPGLQKTAKKRANSKAKERTGTFDEAWDLELDGEVFSVREKLGEGSFGAVFRIAFSADEEEEDAEASFDVDGTELFLAVKVERPGNFWEFFVLDQMQTRLPERAVTSILAPHRLYAYSDESYLLLDLCDRGSLLNAVNKAQEFRIAPPGASVTGLDELLAIFFVIELLRTLEAFHSAGFIHGDLKIDNCLLRFEDVEVPWQSTYDPTGANGWGQKGLKVIDYGRTIDTTMFERGQQFNCDLKSDQYDCYEMQTGRPWKFEPDYHGVASIAYCALFGHYMETETVQVETEGGSRSKRVPKQAFRRYHQVELWTKLFDVLLNPHDVRSDGSLPITNELSAIRSEMEDWLVANCNKNGKSLKSFLSKL
ncbi:hypothetical protein JCM16303_003715 [Sporobolomyces ruberrimus]